ncbi:hypothetical protein GAS19_17385 [Burkholderia glumae]|nr:hypothetical protein Y5A_023650 [Burkholderia glumae AU6208]PNL03008.1 hypothetical protein CEQ24_013150 [Burkholderia glumae]QGA39219.1 hypothetical protein GAS19_17385 [Burkholderia glumae]RQZ76255.1 hypothetical protein DF052_02595 [Burkholderia glumae]
MSRVADKARAAERAGSGGACRKGFGAQVGPERRAGFLEIRRDSNAKSRWRGSYPQGCVVGAGGGGGSRAGRADGAKVLTIHRKTV